MKLHLLTLGHKAPAWVQTGYQNYAQRLPKAFSLLLTQLKPADRSAGQSAQKMMEVERDRLMAALPKDALCVVLDERGQLLTSRMWSSHLQRWQLDGRDVVFVIGGADGLHDDCRARADVLISLSPCTLPHDLVRVVLAEQLYRAVTLLQGHPYHRD